MKARYKKAPGLLTRWFGAEAFVITPASIENLAGVSALIWRRLQRPRSEAEIAASLQKIYPQVDDRQIVNDVQSLLSQLVNKRLIVQLSESGAHKAARQHSTTR